MVFLNLFCQKQRSLKTQTCVRGKNLQFCSPLTFLSQLPCCNIFSKLNYMELFVYLTYIFQI